MKVQTFSLTYQTTISTIRFVVLLFQFTMTDQFVSVYTKLKFHHQNKNNIKKIRSKFYGMLHVIYAWRFWINIFLKSCSKDIISLRSWTIIPYTIKQSLALLFYIPHKHKQTLGISDSVIYGFKHLPQCSIL